MGRVASKRKIKQCDPFFKGTRALTKGKKVVEYDLPPVESKKKSKKRKRRSQIDDQDMEQFVVRMSEVDNNGNFVHHHGNATKKTKKNKSHADPNAPDAAQNAKGALQIAPIQDDETMKQFNRRISQEVKRVIYEESKKGRRANVKRKEFLETKKQKQKAKKLTQQEEYEQQYQKTGSVKKDFFAGAENVKFGERVDAPPVLPKLTGIFKKRAEKAAQMKAEAARAAYKASKMKKNAATAAATGKKNNKRPRIS